MQSMCGKPIQRAHKVILLNPILSVIGKIFFQLPLNTGQNQKDLNAIFKNDSSCHAFTPQSKSFNGSKPGEHIEQAIRTINAVFH